MHLHLRCLDRPLGPSFSKQKWILPVSHRIMASTISVRGEPERVNLVVQALEPDYLRFAVTYGVPHMTYKTKGGTWITQQKGARGHMKNTTKHAIWQMENDTSISFERGKMLWKRTLWLLFSVFPAEGFLRPGTQVCQFGRKLNALDDFLCKTLMPIFEKKNGIYATQTWKFSRGRSPGPPRCWTQVTTALGKSLLFSSASVLPPQVRIRLCSSYFFPKRLSVQETIIFNINHAVKVREHLISS